MEAQREDTDAQIAAMVASGATKRATAKAFGITVAKVTLALVRHDKRAKREASPHLSYKLSTRMVNALHYRDIDYRDDEGALAFIFDEKAGRTQNLGPATVMESQAIARQWIEGKPPAERDRLMELISPSPSTGDAKFHRRLTALEREVTQLRGRLDILARVLMGEEAA